MLSGNSVKNRLRQAPSIGKLDRLVTIMMPVITDGVSNEDKFGNSYTVVDRVWARAENSTGDTDVIGDQVRHVQSTVFTIRYRTDITIKHKIVNEGKMYSVLSAIEFGETRRRFTQISGEYLKDYVIT